MQNKLGWNVAAALMRRWFKDQARTISIADKRGDSDPRTFPPAVIDEANVSMQWALGFARVQLAQDRLLQGWRTARGLVRLKDLLRTAAPLSLPIGKNSWRFGDLSQPAKVLDKTCQVNILDLGTLNDPLDDFYGAMGKATMKIAVSGIVTSAPNNTRQKIAIDEVGFYLRDTYDFNDDSFMSQPLGYWGYSGVQRGLQLRWDVEIDEVYADAESVPMNRLYEVQNDDFQRYRDKYKRGGDFIIYSDVQRMRLPQTIALEV